MSDLSSPSTHEKRVTAAGGKAAASGHSAFSASLIWDAPDAVLGLQLICPDGSIVGHKASGATSDNYHGIHYDVHATEAGTGRVARYRCDKAELPGRHRVKVLHKDGAARDVAYTLYLRTGDITNEVVRGLLPKKGASDEPHTFKVDPKTGNFRELVIGRKVVLYGGFIDTPQAKAAEEEWLKKAAAQAASTTLASATPKAKGGAAAKTSAADAGKVGKKAPAKPRAAKK
jgi:hypothetical protein